MSRDHNAGAQPHAAPGADEQDAPPAGKKSLTSMLPPPLPQAADGEAAVSNVAGLAGRGPDLRGLPGGKKRGPQEPDEPVPARRLPPPVKAERERELPTPAAAPAPEPELADDPFALHLPANRPRPPVTGLPPRGQTGGPTESEDVVEED